MNPIILFSGEILNDPDLVNQVTKKIIYLGGCVIDVDFWVPECTHVICEDEVFERTEKVRKIFT